MKVLHLITWVTTGGIEHWLIDFIRSTSGGDTSMSVCCRKSNTGILAHQLTDHGVRVDSCPMLPNIHTYERRLIRLIRELKVDLIHNHLGATSLLAVKAANRCRVPVITTFHSPRFVPQTGFTRLPLVRHGRSWYTEKSVQYAVEHSQRITGVSKGVLEAIVPQYGSNPRFRVTYLGIPKRSASSHPSDSIRMTHGWAEESKLLFKIGRLSPEKDPLACIEILRRVLQRVPEAKMVFLGDGVLREEIVSTARQYGLEDRIALLGYRKDVPELLLQADLLLQPSKYEGFGLAAIEAATVGVPTIASDVPGLDEAVQHSKTGLLYPVGDIDGMAAGAIELLTQSSMYEAFSHQARRYAEENFSSQRCQSQMLSLYQEVLGDPSRTNARVPLVKT